MLPKLRRAQLVNNMEITGKSDAEMQALVNSGKLDELNNEELLHVATLIEDNALKVKVLEYAAKKYDDSRAYTNLGAAYLQMGDADKALAALTPGREARRQHAGAELESGTGQPGCR